MALVSCGQLFYPNPVRQVVAGAISTNARNQINGSGQRWAHSFVVPRSGTCTKAGIRVNTCASAVTCRLGLYTVDSSGNPTSTTYGGSTYATFTPSANTYSEVTFGTSATMTAGNECALVVEFDSTAGDMFLSATDTAVTPHGQYPLTTKFNGSTWTPSASAHVPFCHIYYSDDSGTYPDIFAIPYTGIISAATYNLNTAGADEYGIKMTVPFACRVVGIWSSFNPSGAGAFECILYDGTTALKTATDTGKASAVTTNVRLEYFSSGQTLTADQTVRAALRPTTTSNVQYRRVALFAADGVQSLGLPKGTCETKRLDQGSWSDTTTNLPGVGLIIDQLDNGASTGGGLFLPRGLTGGFLQ
jgi:hypothetical protein